MKIVSILLLCSILSISDSGEIVENDVQENTSATSRQKKVIIPDRRRLSIFPKYNIKFTVKPHDTKDIKPETDNIREEIGTRKTLMAKIVPMPKKFSLKTTEPMTRKPLMKLRTYTVKMSSNSNNNVKDKMYEKNKSHREMNFIKIDNKASKLSINSMDIEELKDLNSSKEIIGNKISTNFSKSTLDFIDTGKFSKEEEQDRKEFIFLENKSKSFAVTDSVYASEDFETTTTTPEVPNIRRKRSSNIIEEENMGTTVSPLKYTGRDSRLTNDLYFKNINH